MDSLANNHTDNDSARRETLLEAHDIKEVIEDILSGSRRELQAEAAHDLAAIFLPIRDALTEDADERERQKALCSLDDLLEILFLRTETFRAALELYKLDILGLGIGGKESFLELLQREINRARQGMQHEQ